jgi:hypothetical protein
MIDSVKAIFGHREMEMSSPSSRLLRTGKSLIELAHRLVGNGNRLFVPYPDSVSDLAIFALVDDDRDRSLAQSPSGGTNPD